MTKLLSEEPSLREMIENLVLQTYNHGLNEAKFKADKSIDQLMQLISEQQRLAVEEALLATGYFVRCDKCQKVVNSGATVLKRVKTQTSVS